MKFLNGKSLLVTAAAAILALGICGCKKDLQESFQPITFTAVMEESNTPSTKVDIIINKETAKAQVNFTEGDYIIVWDGLRNTQRVPLTKDNINEDGSATFTITIDTATGYYYALASDKDIFDSTFQGVGIYTANGAFNDIAQGRIPHASWAQCSKDERKLVFKNKLCLFRFDTVSDDAAKMVFTGNNDEDVTGCLLFNKESGNAKLYSNDTAEKYVYKDITVHISYWNDDCYFALPAGITFEKGFTLTVYDSDENMLSRATTDKKFTTEAGKIWDLGTLEMSAMTPYELWQEGYSLDIGGVKYNKLTYGDATLIEKGGKAAGAGVFFINEEATAVPAYEGTTLYIGNNPLTYAKLNFEGSLQFGAPGVLAFSNIEMESPTDAPLLDINNKVGDLVFDDCKITLHNAVLDRTTASKCIDNLTLTYSKFIIDIAKDNTDVNCLLNTGSATSLQYSMKQIKVKHNAFWSSEPREFRIVRSAGITDTGASEAEDIAKGVRVGSLCVENNTFYNVDNSSYAQEFLYGYRPFFMLGSVTGTLSINANLVYSTAPLDFTADGTPVGTSRIANILRCYYDTAADNIMGKLSTSDWYGLNPSICQLCIYTEGGGNPTVVKKISTGLKTLTEDPFISIDLSQDIYKKKRAYAEYGAKL